MVWGRKPGQVPPLASCNVCGNGLVADYSLPASKMCCTIKSMPDQSKDNAIGTYGAISGYSIGELVSVSVTEGNDDGFSNKYLEIISTIKYPDSKLLVQHVVWVYPDAVGIRTQLRIKAIEGYAAKGISVEEEKVNSYGYNMELPGARCDYLPLNFTVENQRRYWGYYNNRWQT